MLHSVSSGTAARCWCLPVVCLGYCGFLMAEAPAELLHWVVPRGRLDQLFKGKHTSVDQSFFVGCGAGFSGDRVDAARPVVDTLIKRAVPSALIFENLGERTLAAQQLTKRANPDLGYEPLLELELRPVLADCLQHGITIVSNFGAANPQAAAKRILLLAQELALDRPRIAVVSGDDLSDEKGQTMVKQCLDDQFDADRFICANAYQGAREICDAILAGAQIVVTGRVSDPSLTLGPAMAHFGWSDDDWDVLAGASMAGHLIECGAQVTGGYFADPGTKEVPGMHDIGFPIVEIMPDGTCVVGKADDTGGRVTAATVKEQLLYEVHDPSCYITPDVVADITQAQVTDLGGDRVRLSGVKGQARTSTLKVNVFFDGGWLGEGEISYAGPHAEARARLAVDTLKKRLMHQHQLTLRADLIGICSVFNDDASRLLAKQAVGQHVDVRARVAAEHLDREPIEALLREVTALWTCGPAAGGGVRVNKRQRLSTTSCLIDRKYLPAHFTLVS